MDWFDWLSLFAGLGLIGYLLDREIYFYEGVHLGPRLQAWLYDRWSKKYDEGKRESQLRDAEMLAGPLLKLLEKTPEPFILDFATGTGRLSYALTGQPGFNGHIIALDLSQGMLVRAAEKLSRASTDLDTPATARPAGRVEFLRHRTLPLPFPNAAFDAVCALEVLELFPNMDEALAELSRVLAPGGVLLTSRGTEASGRRAKVKSKLDFGLMLTKHDFETFEIIPWWKFFDRVIAIRNGASEPAGRKRLQDVLQCSTCGQIQWERSVGAMKCLNCGNVLSVTGEGIVLN